LVDGTTPFTELAIWAGRWRILVDTAADTVASDPDAARTMEPMSITTDAPRYLRGTERRLGGEWGGRPTRSDVSNMVTSSAATATRSRLGTEVG